MIDRLQVGNYGIGVRYLSVSYISLERVQLD